MAIVAKHSAANDTHTVPCGLTKTWLQDSKQTASIDSDVNELISDATNAIYILMRYHLQQRQRR